MPQKKGNIPSAVGFRLKALRQSLGVSQKNMAKRLGVSPGTLSLMESGQSPVSGDVIYAIACKYREVDIYELLCGEPTPSRVDAQDVAACVRPIIRPLGDRLDDLPPESVADDYLAVPLLDGQVAAGAGGVVWDQVKSLVWVYKPEVGRRRNLVAVRVAGDSMEPYIPEGAIIIIDRDRWRVRGKRRNVWALRTEDGDIQIKRLHRTDGGLLIISDNFTKHPPEPAWTGDLRKLVVGRVIWMWRSL